VKEERTTTGKESLSGMSDERAKVLLGSPAIAAAVKENVRKGRALIKDLAQSESALKELQTQLTEITDEQTRIRYNLEKLPANSDLHKRLIDKFDKQETALEDAQKQIVAKVAQRKLLRMQYESFLEELKFE
jgi:predicted nuclease with TOPRIM domain